MIEELTEESEVLEVKRVKDDPETHSVAVNSTKAFRDPAMKMDTGIRGFPQDTLALIEETDQWKLVKMQFRQAGDYAGCFTFRIERVEG
jgi:hypothetical protein